MKTEEQKIKYRENNRLYRLNNVVKIRQSQKRWRDNNKEADRKRKREWLSKNKERANDIARKSRDKLKDIVFNHYSAGKLICACCGEKERAFLCIDHINGGGNKHRRSIYKRNQSAVSIYPWLKKMGYPKGFQVLCHNCNMAKGIFGKCPHSSLDIGLIQVVIR